MKSLFVDTSVLLYAVGDEHPEGQDSRHLLAAVTQGELRLHASVEAVQEFLHHRMRRSSRAKAVAQAKLTTNLLVLHAFDGAVLARAIDLVEGTKIRGRDAIHAATALLHGFGSIVWLTAGSRRPPSASSFRSTVRWSSSRLAFVVAGVNDDGQLGCPAATQAFPTQGVPSEAVALIGGRKPMTRIGAQDRPRLPAAVGTAGIAGIAGEGRPRAVRYTARRR